MRHPHDRPQYDDDHPYREKLSEEEHQKWSALKEERAATDDRYADEAEQLGIQHEVTKYRALASYVRRMPVPEFRAKSIANGYGRPAPSPEEKIIGEAEEAASGLAIVRLELYPRWKTGHHPETPHPEQ